MEKLLKKFLLLFCVVALSTAFTGCSSDDDDAPADNIYGTWVNDYDTPNDTSDDDIYTFDKKGTGSLESRYNGTILKKSFEYVYTSSNSGAGTLQLHFVGEDTVYNYSVTRTGNTLMLRAGDGVLILKKK